jgi:transposase-like protein
MAMNRIQFQPEMSVFEFFEKFETEAQCEAAVEYARWPEGFRCPLCGGEAHCVLRSKGRKTFQCHACHHQTSVIAGTLFEGTKLALTVRFLAIYLISQAKTGLSALGFLERPASAQMSQVSGYGANSVLSPPGQDHRRTLLVNAARGRCLRRRWRLADRRIVTR